MKIKITFDWSLFPKSIELDVALPVEITLPVVTPVVPAPVVPLKPPSEKIASTAPIGQIIDGVKITHYGYVGDSSPDSNSMAGLGDRGNKLIPNVSVALTRSQRMALFGVEKPSTGKTVTIVAHDGVYNFTDDDQAPESDKRIDVYDPYYTGRDVGCTDEMYAKSLAEMKAAGILT